MSKISVIVPVYKVEEYIHRCIDSILTQTFSDFDLILVDDGSPDNCGMICEEYAAKDRRIVVIHKKNGGLSSARNAGIDWSFSNSGSQWLTFIDSDDYIHPEYLERLYNACTNLHSSISVCNSTSQVFCNTESDYIPQRFSPEYVFCDNHLRRNIIFAWGKLYNKSLWDGIRFPEGKIHEDRFTTHKLLFQVSEIAYIEAALYFYTINVNGISRSKWTLKRLDDLEALEEQYQFFQENQYYNAFHRTALSAVHMIPEMIQNIRGLSISHKEKRLHIHQLRKKLRFYMKQHKTELNINLNNFCAAYEAAYPVRMKLYWYGRAVLRKLRLVK